MKIIQLTIDNWLQYSNLVQSQKSFFGIKDEEVLKELINNPSVNETVKNCYFLNNNLLFRSYGLIDDNGDLLSSINVQFSDSLPFWILRRMITHEENKSSENSLYYMGELFTHVLKETEKLGFYQHYNLIPTKYKAAHEKIWSKLPARAEYKLFEIENVPAMAKPKFSFFWDSLYGKRYYPIDTTIRLSIK